MQNKIDGSISGKFVAVNNLSDIPFTSLSRLVFSADCQTV